MPETRKVSEEQLQALKSMQAEFDRLTKTYGELHFQQRLVDKELNETDDALAALEERRRAATKELIEQFGTSGTVSLDTGEFIPD